MERSITIVGLVVNNRADHAPAVQEVLTRYGSHIISRSGVPAPGKHRGIITLTMETTAEERQQLESDLQQIPGVQVAAVSLEMPSN